MHKNLRQENDQKMSETEDQRDLHVIQSTAEQQHSRKDDSVYNIPKTMLKESNLAFVVLGTCYDLCSSRRARGGNMTSKKAFSGRQNANHLQEVGQGYIIKEIRGKEVETFQHRSKMDT